jgi:hypothetical protein
MRLRQIILNLVYNAIKFTPAGGHVELTLRSEMSAHQCRLLVSVRDTGLGLTAEQISRLFHSFTQAEPGTARQYGGSGMGLAVSKRLALLLGGDVTVSSTPGEGSEFTASVLCDLPAIDVSRSAFMRPPGDGDEHTIRTCSDGCADAWCVYKFCGPRFGSLSHERRNGWPAGNPAVPRCWYSAAHHSVDRSGLKGGSTRMQGCGLL